MTLNSYEMSDFAHKLALKFTDLYNEMYAVGDCLEDPNILESGYCFYFARLLKTLLPEGDAINTYEGHYIFKYDDQYYDWHGIIPKYSNLLETYSHGIIDTEKLNAMDEQDYAMAEILTTNQFKDATWNKIEPALLEYANSLLNQLTSEESQRTI